MGFEKYVVFPIDVFCDNERIAIELSKNTVCHKRSKHIDISYYFTRELVEKKRSFVICRSMIPADILTKPLPRCGHLRGVRMLNLNVEDILTKDYVWTAHIDRGSVKNV